MNTKNLLQSLFKQAKNSKISNKAFKKHFSNKAVAFNLAKNAQNQAQFKLFGLSAALGLTFAGYCLNKDEKTNLDGFYEVTLNDDFQDGEKRQVQVGPKEQDAILVVKYDGKYYAVSNSCPHFGFPLNKGVLYDDKITCSLHMAQFSIKTGENEYGPVFNGLETFEVTEKDGKIHIKVPKDKLNKARALPMSKKGDDKRRFVIIGGGPAGLSAAETLRQSGFEGDITIISSEEASPYDRTILSKNAKASLSGIQVRSDDFLKEYDINLIKGASVTKLDTSKNFIETKDGKHYHFEKVLIASGSSPRIPSIKGVNGQGVHALRTISDLEKIRNSAQDAKNIVILGASFIGLESASALKDLLKGRDPKITVLDVSEVPVQRAFGKEIGEFVQGVHEKEGIKFQLKTGVKSIVTDKQGKVTSVELTTGETIPADLVILGTGVAPNTQFLRGSLKLGFDGGIMTDIFHKAQGQQNVFAAGDVAEYPWWYTGENLRVEHYNEAIHQGYISALNMLGKSVPNDNVPFFWTRWHQKSLSYVGNAKVYDSVHIDGSLKEGKFVAYYILNNKIVAAASMGVMNSMQILHEAMRLNILPKGTDLISGRVTLKEIDEKVKAQGKKCKCQRGGLCGSKNNKQQQQ